MYIVEKHEIISEEGRRLIVFGISCIQGNQIVGKIDDVSTNRTLVAKMAYVFNACKLHPQHFKPAVNVLVSLDYESLESMGMYEEVC